MTNPSIDEAGLRGLLAEHKDHFSATGEDLSWLIEQSLKWPTRVDPDRTTSDRFLRFSMAATLLDALDELSRLRRALENLLPFAEQWVPRDYAINEIEEARSALNQETDHGG